MATWTLLHTRSPLNTSSGNGQYGELTMASSRQLNFSTVGDTSLTFNMPGSHWQTAQIVPLVSDVLVFRDDVPVQRFRVVSRQLDKSDGVLTASFSCVSYKALVNAWIFHKDDTRSWSAAGDPMHAAGDGVEVYQDDIAWKIFNDGQTKPYGTLGVTRGNIPTSRIPIVYSQVVSGTTVWHGLYGPDSRGGIASQYFDAGKSRGDAIQELASLVGGGPAANSGFEWDVEPDPANPYTAMKFNVWALADGGRSQRFTTSISSLVLDDGGSLAAWSHTITPTEYANVIRFSGAEPTRDNDGSAAVDAVYKPGENPATVNGGAPPEGRWERDINNADVSADQVDAAATNAYKEAHDYVPELAVTLRRGRWEGPSQLWLGDKARVIITEAVAGLDHAPDPANPSDWILYVNETAGARVVEISITVDDLGAEDVSLALVRAPYSTRRDLADIYDRISRLERR